MTREQYESLSATVLRDLAKTRGLTGIGKLKKEELVEAMLAEDKRLEAEGKSTAPPTAPKAAADTKEGAARPEAASKAESASKTEPQRTDTAEEAPEQLAELDSGIEAHGILEVMQDGFGFIRSANYLPGENDVYDSPSQIRRFNLKTGDIVRGNTRVRSQNEKFSALLFINSVNGVRPEQAMQRKNFEDLTPIFPDERLSRRKNSQ